VGINASTTINQVVYYTISTNGGAGITPTTVNSFIYSAPFHLPVGTYTVEAAVYDPAAGWGNPDMVTYVVTLSTGVVSKPAISFGCALRSDGTVWAWGINANGELGNNSTENSSVPVQVPGLTGATAIADGYAVKADGSVWAWGYGPFGQLGNGTYDSSNVPVQAYGLNLLALSPPSLAINSQTGSGSITSLTPIYITASPGLSTDEAIYWNTTGFPVRTSDHLYQNAGFTLSESSIVYAAVYDCTTGQWNSQAAAFTVATPGEPMIISYAGFDITTSDPVGKRYHYISRPGCLLHH
jgi:hypothetical protein